MILLIQCEMIIFSLNVVWGFPCRCGSSSGSSGWAHITICHNHYLVHRGRVPGKKSLIRVLVCAPKLVCALNCDPTCTSAHMCAHMCSQNCMCACMCEYCGCQCVKLFLLKCHKNYITECD